MIIACSTAANVAFSQEDFGFKFLEVKVVDSQGKPLGDVSVDIGIDGSTFPMPTDDAGVVAFNIPTGDETRLTLQVKHSGSAAIGASWAKGDTIPDSFTIPLEKGPTIGGSVHDEQGQPVEGVEVKGMIFGQSDASKGKLRPTISDIIATTDEAGKWRFTSAPTTDVNLQFQFSHPDFVSVNQTAWIIDEGFDRHGWTWEQLLALDQVHVLRKGLSIIGRVVDPEGNPVAGAKVTLGVDGIMSGNPTVTTDAEGKFAFEKLPEQLAVLTVIAEGWAPELHSMYTTAETTAKPIDIQLSPPSVLRIRAVNPEGEPIPGVGFVPEYWRGYRSLYTKVNGKTDEQGIWEWNEAPADAVRYQISAKDYFGVPSSRAEFSASNDVQDLVMLPAASIIGTVIDKATREPIKEFTYAQWVWRDDDRVRPLRQSVSLPPGQSGKFVISMQSACVKYMYYVEANGYRPSRSRAIRPKEGDLELMFELEPCESIQGTVKLPSGEPVEGASVLVATPLVSLHFLNGNFYTEEVRETTDSAGQFKLHPDQDGFLAVFWHEHGVAQLPEKQLLESTDVVLQPWASVEGTIAPGTRRLATGSATLTGIEQAIDNQNGQQENRGSKDAHVSWYYRTEPDATGKFVMERVPPSPMVVGGSVPIGPPGRQGYYATHTQVVEPVADGTAKVMLGGSGAVVTGQATLPDAYHGESPWQRGFVNLKEYAAREPASKLTEYRREYTAAFDSDGRFEFVDIPPGEYELVAKLYTTEPDGGGWNVFASAERIITVSEVSGGDKPTVVDFGMLELTLAEEE